MITTAEPMIEFDATAVGASGSNGMLRVKLADGREIDTPIEYFPRLQKGIEFDRPDQTKFQAMRAAFSHGPDLGVTALSGGHTNLSDGCQPQ